MLHSDVEIRTVYQDTSLIVNHVPLNEEVQRPTVGNMRCDIHAGVCDS
jgi:hypothetical protein